MTWFSLPETNESNTADFSDSASAVRGLATQPQANASAMLVALVYQIKAYNCFTTSPRERFRTLEALRKTVFAVSGECQKRYENKPLPLLPVEQASLASACQLWQSLSVGYLHCLRACLDQNPSVTSNNALIAHRVLACLRMEQLNCYLAGTELDGEFWRNLHAVLSSAEHLGVLLEPVKDSMLGETSDSTLSGQYCMAVLLHLACPFSLTRSQFSAVIRWFARWREQVSVLLQPETSPKSCCIVIDLSQDQPIHDNQMAVVDGRWLSLNALLRKMHKRIRMLSDGESPENLKLGNALSSDACNSLLTLLCDQLQHPQLPLPDVSADSTTIQIAYGLENIHGLLGGKGLRKPSTAISFGEHLRTEQLAVFDHIVQPEDSIETRIETWKISQLEPGVQHLVRPAGLGEGRLMLKSVLAIQQTLHGQTRHLLAAITRISARGPSDSSLNVTVTLLPGEPEPLIAELREKPSGALSRHPALLLPAVDGKQQASVILPPGLQMRALSIRFYEARNQQPMDFRLGEPIERNSDNERWSLLKPSV